MTECIQQMNEELRNYHVSLAAVVRYLTANDPR